ncbi:kinase-like domain-containing protein [Cladochytrium replicatum]|nr:kinase-like domain-containing protein [Cladochytrium replicatum]
MVKSTTFAQFHAQPTSIVRETRGVPPLPNSFRLSRPPGLLPPPITIPHPTACQQVDDVPPGVRAARALGLIPPPLSIPSPSIPLAYHRLPTPESPLPPLVTDEQPSPTPTISSLASSSSESITSGSPPGYAETHLHDHPLLSHFLSHYALGEELGSGGFGFVHVALRRFDCTEVAVKFILRKKVPAASCVMDQDLGAVPMEVFALKNLRHSNIIQFLDYFEDARYFYLVTELHGSPWSSTAVPTPGISQNSSQQQQQQHTIKRRTSCDLFECIEQHTRFPEPLARHIFRQIVRALAHLHSLSIVHRDIKDENILVDASYNVKLIDFGSAAFFARDGSTEFDRFFGTFQYAAPEILRGERYSGPQAEVWALGCCLYVMLTGEAPFDEPAHAMGGQWERKGMRMSREAVRLLERMFCVDVRGRANIGEILHHPWVIGDERERAM